jgi:hypothetical protein
MLALVGLSSPSIVDAQGKTVTVEAEGISPADARERAMRKALEEGGQVWIDSRSKTKNFQLLCDAIHTKANGILRDVEVLEEKPIIGGTHLCRLRATVVLDSLASEWGDLVALLEASGNPRIIVTMRERIDDLPQEYSTVEAKISGYLASKGFTVLDAEQVKQIGIRKGEKFDITDTKFLQSVARDQGAEVFVKGSSSASFARWHKSGGASVAIYNCNMDVSMFNTDDASLIVRENIPQFQGGARTDSAPSVEAGKMALDNAGDEILQRIYKEAIRKWAVLCGGSREITFEVRKVPNLGIAKKMGIMLREIEGVKNVIVTFDSEVANLRISATMSADVLSDHLVIGDWERLVTLEEAQRNVIRGAYIGVVPERPTP